MYHRVLLSLLPIISLTALSSTAAKAQDLPRPVIERASPQMVYLGHTKLDDNGRFAITLIGHDLGPNDGDNGHPAGWRGGYQHIFVRSVSAGNVAGPWAECQGDACIPYGSTGVERDEINLGLNPNYYLGQAGSHVQVKLWVSFSADNASEPQNATTRHSDWSPIFTVDTAPAGAMPPVPTISHFEPAVIEIGPGKTPNWWVRLIGKDLCQDSTVVIFNGDEGNSVKVPPTMCSHNLGPSYASGSELLDLSIPEWLRHEGVIRVDLRNNDGAIASQYVTVKSIAVKLERPGNINIPAEVAPQPQTQSVPQTVPQTAPAAQPPVRVNRKPRIGGT